MCCLWWDREDSRRMQEQFPKPGQGARIANLAQYICEGIFKVTTAMENSSEQEKVPFFGFIFHLKNIIIIISSYYY